jgi:hypothetical protein
MNYIDIIEIACGVLLAKFLQKACKDIYEVVDKEVRK